ncbi:U32 family peptidase [Anthocerotibacter panamensis]|uniref:U32 family peptidase n=1 Tax=Anthocerotibacter panamensis TaxID=2857077 RepID=UPI001FD9F6A2|nr:U32 family peptidase [Anthocerotibacter panamensis]
MFSATPSETLPLMRPELLAPAGDWDCVKAAVENGADAVYFGLERFNARMRAQNFTEAQLPEVMAFLHRRGVKGYVTFNTLVFANELAAAEQYLRTIIAAGVDAVIVQDLGICRLIRQLSADFPIHASTQMTITSAQGVAFARELGCNLVVLARECSLQEITKIQQQLAKQAIDLPLEVFVHGALCVAYSGQCLTSEALGGRSANRGECAQACRMPYELFSDGEKVPLDDKKYLLSPQDLAGLEILPELVRAGVTSLKIEGRLKSPQYVANVTRVYRQALDRAMDCLSHPQVSDQERYDLEMGFSRGLTTGWFQGINHQELVHARFGKKRGVYLGEVTRIRAEHVTIALQAPLKPGDGIVFDAGHPEAPEEGGHVYTVEVSGTDAILSFGRGSVDFRRVKVGDKAWKTSDPELDRRLRQSFTGDQPQFQRPIHLEVFGSVDEPLTIVARDEGGHVVQVTSAMPLVTAHKQPLDTGRLREQLGRLGGTPFTLIRLDNQLVGSVLLPVSELNRLRRAFVAELENLRTQPQRWQLNPPAPHSGLLPWESESTAQLNVLVRNLPQLEAALKAGIQTLYGEFEDPRAYREAVQRVRRYRAENSAPATLWVAPPRITKPGEDGILRLVRSSDADGYLVRNYDHLAYFKGERCIGDFSLNIANPLSADYFKNHLGLERLTCSYDLNIAQLEALLTTAPPPWFEVTIHQHMPMFHMEHCVFCAFLCEGTDYTNCGRPCEKHEVKLRDRVGVEHVLKADAGCRNTVFSGRAQTGAEYVTPLQNLGLRHFRLEFLDESPTTVTQTIARYQKLLEGKITGTQLWRELRLQNQLGVTRGPMEHA